MQVCGRRRERARSCADPRRDAAHAAVQIHAAVGAGGRRGAARHPAAGTRAAAAAQASPRQLTASPRIYCA